MVLEKIRNYSILLLIAAALVISGYYYWQYQQRYPNTNDAYIEAHVLNIAPQVTGRVAQVFVRDQEHVTKGQVLFTIDPAPFQLAYDKAKANLDNTAQSVSASQSAVVAAQANLLQQQAQLVDAQKHYDRVMPLIKQGYYARSGGDTATRQLTVAKQAVHLAQAQLNEAKARLGQSGETNAQIQAAKATLAQAALDMQYTSVRAPANGQLAQLSLQPGQTVSAYQSLFSLVTDENWWAMANMKETDLNRIRIGQHAVINVDMYPSHPFQGVVTSISPGSGSSFALLPAENATGNWVKVTQRFPVRVEISQSDPRYPLRIGSSCSVTIDTRRDQASGIRDPYARTNP